MDFKFLYHRIRNLVLNPVAAWDAIHSENRPLRYVRGSFFLPLTVLVAVSAFLGALLFTHTGFSEVYPVLIGIKYFLLFLISAYATTFIFMEVTKSFGLGSDFTVSFKIIVYSVAPFLICQIISRLIESFIFVNLLALYGLYIFWTGTEKMINPPEQRKIQLLLAATFSFILVFVIANWLLSGIIDKIYFAFLS